MIIHLTNIPSVVLKKSTLLLTYKHPIKILAAILVFVFPRHSTNIYKFVLDRQNNETISGKLLHKSIVVWPKYQLFCVQNINIVTRRIWQKIIFYAVWIENFLSCKLPNQG